MLVRPHLTAAVRAALTSATPYEVIRVGREPAVLTVTGEVLPPPRAGLTVREWEVLALLATGLTSAQAARRLGVSARTVEKHMQHVHVKLGATGRVDAVARGRALRQPRW
ncbi:response regulator transcription factor [uncultured Pseudokineococcus sp.]|uniref:response regulator transcription factor n=1 Tax=uncultured Pseudokineococcus sp. TaxID=1642928 RepID=UPI00260B1908|nr:helix-turn-helix transcriptional regulator [uncultured Pseudokineococcus sp.]